MIHTWRHGDVSLETLSSCISERGGARGRDDPRGPVDRCELAHSAVTRGDNSERPDRGDTTHTQHRLKEWTLARDILKTPDHGKHPLHPNHLWKLSSFRNRAVTNALFLWLVGCKIQKFFFLFFFFNLSKWLQGNAFVWSASYSILMFPSPYSQAPLLTLCPPSFVHKIVIFTTLKQRECGWFPCTACRLA